MMAVRFSAQSGNHITAASRISAPRVGAAVMAAWVIRTTQPHGKSRGRRCSQRLVSWRGSLSAIESTA